MKTISAKEFTKKYDLSLVIPCFELICEMTKTGYRVKPLSSLTTQSKIMYTLAKSVGAESLFEIGTGRGTTSYSVSLLPHWK